MIARVGDGRYQNPTVTQSFDDIRSDYEATKNSRFNRRRVGLAPQGGPGDYHFRSEAQYYDLIERARDLDRNDSIVGQVIDRACSNIIQDGFTLIPSTGDEALDLDLWERWKAFAESPDECDIAGEMTWCDYEFAAIRGMLVDGDCFITATRDGPLQFWEGHTVKTSKRQAQTVLGVTIDKFRKRTRVWFRGDEASQPGRVEKSTSMAVRHEDGYRQVFQVYKLVRTTLTRGVTVFGRIFTVAGMLDDISFSELVKRQAQSCFVFFREQAATAAQSNLPTINGGYGEASTETTPAGTRQMDNVAPGMEVTGRPGEKLNLVVPAIPNSDANQHFWQNLSIVGSNIGLAPCQVLLDFSRENYVGFRGAVDESRKGFRVHQKNLATRFHRPAYTQRVHYWAEEDPAIKAQFGRTGIDPLGHIWQVPAFKYVEPVNDAAGDLLRVRNGLTSRRRLAAEQALDWETIAEESVKDNEYAIEQAQEAADRLNKKFKTDQFTWRDCINLPTADGIQVSLQSQPGGEPSAAGSKVGGKASE